MLKYVVIGLMIGCTSCNLFKSDSKTTAIARVNSDYLYKEDITNLIPPGIAKEDSIVIVRNFIDRWAAQKLLIRVAEVNLNASKKDDGIVSPFYDWADDGQ